MKFKLLFFLVISFIIGIGASFADYEVIIEDVNYSGSYPSEGISMSITTNNDIVKAPTLTLKPDNPEYEDMIHAQIISCGGDNACIAKIEYDKELPTGKYTGKIIFTYQKNGSTGQYTSTGSYTLDIIQPDFEKDGVFVDDIIFNDIIAGYKHRKRQPVIIRNDTDKRVVMTSISVTDILSIKPIFKGEIQSEDHGIIEYNGILDEGQYTEELIIGYGEEFGKETNQITGLIILNAIPIDNIFEVTGTSIDFGQIEWGYENVDKKIITIINPTDSDIEIKEIKLDTSDNPNINEIFEILDSALYTTLGQKEAADVATITMKRGLNVGLYTGKVEIIYQKDDKEYSIRSYLTGKIVGISYKDNVTKYIDTNGKEFSMGTITISDGTDSITVLDRNLGATTNDITKEGSYGYYFQRGNNYGFSMDNNNDAIIDGPTNGFPDTSSYSRNNPYVSGTFISDTNDIKYGDWSNTNNDNLWGGNTDYKRQGPCPAGYHIPTSGERLKLVKLYWKMYPGDYPMDEESMPGKHVIRDDLFISDFQNGLKIPLAGHRSYKGENEKFGLYSYLWSSSAKYNYPSAYAFGLSPAIVRLATDDDNMRGDAQSVRCFKDETDNIVILNYDSRGGTKIQAQSLSKGDNGYVPYIPKRDGVELLGWYSDFNLSTVWNNDIINKDTTIYAKWSDDIKPEPIPSHSGGGGHHKNIVNTGDKKENKSAKSELELAYEFALQNGIDILDNLEESTVKGGLTRIAMAKMLSQYAINILGKVPANKIVPKYKDITKELNEKYDGAIELAYQLGIMGIGIDSYRPFDLVPRAEFVTALSRMLYGLQDGTENYYSTHMDKLKKEGILTNTNPNMQELKGYVLIMLMRSAKN